MAVRHFRYYLDGRSFTVFTDHKPFTFAFNKVSDPWSNRQQRRFAAISEFTTDVRHIAGKRIVVADALSRATLGSALTSFQQEVDYVELAKDQQCQEIKDYRTSITGLRFEKIPVGAANVPLLCDVSTGVPRPFVPSTWRKKMFDVIHGLSHSSIRATRQLMASKFVGMVSKSKSGNGLSNASRAKNPKSTNMSNRRFVHIHRQFIVSIMLTSTLLGLHPSLKEITIC